VPFLTVIGHSNIDVLLNVASMPGGGRSSPVKSRQTVYGGTAANIARHAGGLAVPVRLWSRVGTDFPADWRADLKADGVELAFDEVGVTPTCYVLTTPDGEQAYCMDQGAMTPPYTVPGTVLDGDVKWLHVCTGDPGSYEPLVDAARAAGIKIAFDPGQEIHFAYDERSFNRMLERADVVFLNEVELVKALGFCGYGSAEQLLDHVDAVIVTRGGDGADLWTSEGKTHEPAPHVKLVDSTGAGDGLRAGWYRALYAGETMQEALKVGVLSGAVVVTMEGPQPRAITVADLETS
jgi:sugar/nucleoside kinase (ribokinase family)